MVLQEVTSVLAITAEGMPFRKSGPARYGKGATMYPDEFERQSELRRLRHLQRRRQLYRLGLITLGFCFALLVMVVVCYVLRFLQ